MNGSFFAFWGNCYAFVCRLEYEVLKRGLVFEIALVLAAFYLKQRRLRDVEVAVLRKMRHLPVEKREEQRPDVAAVHIRIGHDYDPVVTEFGGVIFISSYAAS